MSVRQYVGARYVPKFYENPDGSSDWLPGVSYEPLTVVTYGGNSFTSKKDVPTTVGAPNTASEYWASTGVYNQQVELYRQDVTEYREEVEIYTQSLDGRFAAFEQEITGDLTTFKQGVDSDLTTFKQGVDSDLADFKQGIDSELDAFKDDTSAIVNSFSNRLRKSYPPLFVAHAGCGEDAPINSYAAFETAIAYGYKMIEFDVQFSSDGVPFCIHDRNIGSVSTTTGDVGSFTANQLSQIAYGPNNAFIDDYPTQYLCSMEKALVLMRAGGVTPIIEIKQDSDFLLNDNSTSFINIIKKLGMIDKVIVISFNKSYCDEVIAKDASISVMYMPQTMPTEGDVIELANNGYYGINVDKQFLTQNIAEAAHNNGIKIGVYTIYNVNDRPQITNALNYGVDFITTNSTTLATFSYNPGSFGGTTAILKGYSGVFPYSSEVHGTLANMGVHFSGRVGAAAANKAIMPPVGYFNIGTYNRVIFESPFIKTKTINYVIPDGWRVGFLNNMNFQGDVSDSGWKTGTGTFSRNYDGQPFLMVLSKADDAYIGTHEAIQVFRSIQINPVFA